MADSLPLGKLDPELLVQLLAQLPKFNHRVIVPPGIGCDAAGVSIGRKLIAVTTDPITISSKRLGTYAIAVNINDIACLGCEPKFFTSNILLPKHTTKKALTSLWDDLLKQLAKYDIQAIGGHIEITEAVNQPVIIGEMIGEAISNHLLNPSNSSPSDSILLWQGISIEGTALLARERPDGLSKHFSDKKIKAMQKLLDDPGICVWPLVKKLVPHRGLVALHDPTEGGLATAIHELADATKCGAQIDGDAIKILPETQALADIYGFDPLGLIASGSLLILCRESTTKSIMNHLRDEPIAYIGKLTKKSARTITTKGKQRRLPRYNEDEVIKALKKISA